MNITLAVEVEFPLYFREYFSEFIHDTWYFLNYFLILGSDLFGFILKKKNAKSGKRT
jgi:hypothetical protein